MIDAIRPRQRAMESESRQEYAACLCQVAALSLPTSISTNLLVRALALILPSTIVHQSAREIVQDEKDTAQAAAFPEVALESAVVIPIDIKRNHQTIVVGVAPFLEPSTDKKGTENTNSVSVGNIFQCLQSSLSETAGVANTGQIKKNVQAIHSLYGDWLTLDATK